MSVCVTQLTLAQFRSHARAQLRLDGRPVAIHGPNGAGKTNILEAVSLLSPGRGLRRATAAEIARRPAMPGWKVTAEIRSARGAHEIETWSEAGASRQVRIDGKMSSPSALGARLPLLWLVPAMDRLWVEGADGRRRFLDRMTLSFDPGHADRALAYEKAMRERNRLLKDQVGNPSWYEALEAQMAGAAQDIQTARAQTLGHLSAAQAAAETAFPVADLALDPGEAGLPDSAAGLRQVWAATRGRDMAAGRTLIGPHRSDLVAVYAVKDVPARDCSTGEQKALLISLILANARALAARDGAPPLLLLDEVAAHLDDGRRASLYDEICALGAQAWMTGTGPDLFAHLGPRAQHFAVTETDGVSTVMPA